MHGDETPIGQTRPSYTTVDITANARISDRLRNEGWRQMPVIIADDESWSGYRPDKIHELEARCR